MNIVYKGNDSAFSFLWPISKKMDKNTNIKSQNIKTSIKNYCISNFVKVFNNSSFFMLNKIIYSSKFLTELLKPVKLKIY